MTSWFHSAALIAALAPLVGCSLYFGSNGDDDTRCASTPPSTIGATLRNPATGGCQVFQPSGGDACGAPIPVDTIPNWPSCDTSCDALDEQDCTATSGCHAYYSDPCGANEACEAPVEFVACGSVGQPAPAAGSSCASLGAAACANSDWCISNLLIGTDGDQFVSCYDNPTPPPTTCFANTTCAAGYYCDFDVAVPGHTCDGQTNGCVLVGLCEPIPSPPVQQACNTTADCLTGFQCEFLNQDTQCPEAGCGVCVAAPPDEQCYYDTECASGYQCISNETGGPVHSEPCNSEGCMDAGVCELIPNVGGSCVSDANCATGYECVGMNGIPVPPSDCASAVCGETGTCQIAACAVLTTATECEARSDCADVFNTNGCVCPTDETCNCPNEEWSGCTTANGAVPASE